MYQKPAIGNNTVALVLDQPLESRFSEPKSRSTKAVRDVRDLGRVMKQNFDDRRVSIHGREVQRCVPIIILSSLDF